MLLFADLRPPAPPDQVAGPPIEGVERPVAAACLGMPELSLNDLSVELQQDAEEVSGGHGQQSATVPPDQLSTEPLANDREPVVKSTAVSVPYKSPVNHRSPPPQLEVDTDGDENDTELLGPPVDKASVPQHKAQDVDKKPVQKL